MKKFNQYLKPEKKKKDLSLTERAWLDAKKKIEEEQKQSELNKLEEQKKEEELRKKLYVEKIVDVNVIREEFVGKNIIEEESQPEEVISEPQPLIEQIVVQGEPGPQGPQGPKGDQGERGEKGERGEPGVPGTPGIRGLTGERGEKGDIGPQGIQGEQGIPGVAGQNGKDGEPGPKGEQGNPGRDGVDGKEGPVGPKGDKGDRGEKGQDGKDGLNGKDGRDGQDGKPGPKGEKGDRGERGEIGPQGPKGDDGQTPDIKPLFEKFNKLSLDINKKVGRIVGDVGALAGGGGSGSYWLNDLGDTDYSSIVNATDQQVLTFSSATGKWVAADSQGGGGGGTLDQWARNRANAAFLQANTPSYTANSASSYANSAFIHANAAFAYANTISFTTDPSAGIYANGAFLVANTADTKATSAGVYANSAFIHANAAFNKANTPQSQLVNGSDTLSLNGANKVDLPGGSAYIFSALNNITLAPDNTGNNYLEIINNVGATISTDRGFDIRTNSDGTDKVWSFTQGGSLFFPDSTFQTTAFKGTAIDQTARDTANSAFITANSSSYYANVPSYTSNSASTYANGAFLAANTADTKATSAGVYANGAFITANTAEDKATSAGVYANGAFTVANSAFLQANTPSHVANSAASYANSAFNKANTAITTSGGSITGQLNVTYAPASTVGAEATLKLSGANTKGGTSYADVLQLTNNSAGVTSPNKFIRINNIGTLEIINSAYTANPLALSDTGDLSVSGNVTSAGVKSGHSSGRPGFRVVGGGTTNNLTTTQNGTGQLNSNNWTVIFNQGSYLNSGTGTFTAPVEGLYQVNVVGRNSGYASGISQLAVRQNNDVVIMIEFAASSSMNHVGGSAVVKMAAGDTLKLFVLAGQINFDQNDNWSVAYIG